MLPTGPCCLVGKEAGELTPRGVMNTLSKPMLMRRPIDRQVLTGDQIKRIDNATAMLVGEIAPSPAGDLMDARHDLTPSDPLRRSPFFLAEAPLRHGKCVFLTMEETWGGDLLPVTES